MYGSSNDNSRTKNDIMDMTTDDIKNFIYASSKNFTGKKTMKDYHESKNTNKLFGKPPIDKKASKNKEETPENTKNPGTQNALTAEALMSVWKRVKLQEGTAGISVAGK